MVLGRPRHKPRLRRLQQSPAGAVSLATRRGGPAINADRAGRADTQRRCTWSPKRAKAALRAWHGSDD